MKEYNVTVRRVVEHETTYNVFASNEEEAEEFVLEGNYNEVISDSEMGEMEDFDIINIEYEK